MERTWSKIKDVDMQILENLDDASLLNFCSVNRYSSELCNNEDFWHRRLKKNYPDIEKYKSPNRKWKNFYISYVYYLNYGKENANIGQMTMATLKAVQNGDLDLIKYFVDERRVDANNFNMISEAAEENRKDIIDFLISRGATYLENGIYAAAKGGHLDLLIYLENKLGERKDRIRWVNVLEWAGQGKGGNKEVIDYVINKKGVGVRNISRGLIFADDKETKRYLKSLMKSSYYK